MTDPETPDNPEATENTEASAPETEATGTADTALGSGDDAVQGAADPGDWRADLPDDLRDWSKKFTSREAALKSHRELESRLGKSVVLPGDDATPEQIAEFRKKALGVPDAPDGYEIKLPEDLPDALKSDDEGVKARLGKFAEVMHGAGAPPEAVQAASDFYHQMLVETLQQQEQALTAKSEQAITELDREWGGDKEANDTYGKRAVALFDDTDGRFKEFLNTSSIDGIPAGNHPEFRRMFARIGRAMAEDRPHMNPTEDEARSIQSEVDKVRADKEAALRKGDRAEAQRLDEVERQLYAKQHGDAPIVGSRQRQY